MIPQILTNMNLFLAGDSYAGRVAKVTLPKLKRKVEAHRGGGMDAEIDMAVGLEKLEADFTLVGFDVKSLSWFGISDGGAFNGNFRGSFTDRKGKKLAAIVHFRGMLNELDMGSWEPGKKDETKYAISLDYYKLEADGQVLFEIDPVNCIRIVDGKDELAAERAALGI
ncbi:Phage tail tube protein FII [Chromobacterium vaccinii]|nr:Phage tail tube protein FII [Chromobacterium vaccinii]QND89013.1 Phage tail tube protein FII [Chromobacterium vaccinii]